MVTNGYVNSVLLSCLIKIYAPFPTLEKQILASMCQLDCMQVAQIVNPYHIFSSASFLQYLIPALQDYISNLSPSC